MPFSRRLFWPSTSETTIYVGETCLNRDGLQTPCKQGLFSGSGKSFLRNWLITEIPPHILITIGYMVIANLISGRAL
jgi:hypothetical protein